MRPSFGAGCRGARSLASRAVDRRCAGACSRPGLILSARCVAAGVDLNRSPHLVPDSRSAYRSISVLAARRPGHRPGVAAPQPVEEFGTPERRIARLQHLVVLIWKSQRPRIHALGFERVVAGEALLVGHAVVARTMDHEGRRVHRRDEVARALRVHAGRVFPISGTQFLGVRGKASSLNIACQSKQPAWQTQAL